jgi:hypothetical protein
VRTYPQCMKLRTAFIVIAAASVAILLAPQSARSAAPSGIAYDEITKIILGSPSPEPGSFSEDFAAALDAEKNAAAPGAHHGLFGNIMNAMDMAKNAMNLSRTGTATSKYYLGALERSDDPGAQTATISKPQQHQIVYLNIAKKTYRVMDTNIAAPTVTPPPMERARSGGGATPAPGTGKLDITVSSTALGSRTIENVPTSGYKMSFTLSETQSTGSCTDGNFTTSIVEYVSRYAEPRTSAGRTEAARVSSMRPELMALKPGCTPTITMHTAGGAKPPAGRIPMWMLVTISAGAPTAQGQMSGGFSTLIERGNVRTLTAADKKLFDIPADYSREP